VFLIDVLNKAFNAAKLCADRDVPFCLFWDGFVFQDVVQ
jgi:hypothetical protein